MFSLSFWRGLVGESPKKSKVEASSKTVDERRAWPRRETDGQATFKIEATSESLSFRAKVRDLSRGGVNLIVDRQFEVGQMLRLEFPTDIVSLRTLLACVVRVTPLKNARWSLGCVFSGEFNDEDLCELGLHKSASSGRDQRVWVRHTCAVRARYRRFGDPASEKQPVEVLNISATGVGLVLAQSPDPGAVLNIELFTATGHKACGIMARVVHATRRPTGDHAVGCCFVRALSEEELEVLC